LIALIFATVSAEVSLQQLNDDNYKQILKSQIEEFEKPEKKQKGLILAFVSRKPGSLDFQRELLEVSKIVARQYYIYVVDC
jgi:hypothetical protein